MAVRKNIPETDTLTRAGLDSLSIYRAIPGLMLASLLFLFQSSALAGDFLLYLPKQVETSVPPLPGEGVLVRKITIQQGDTLTALSRRFAGKGGYYPQILLFNNIRDPNLIYAGQEMLVPLSGRGFRNKISAPVAAMRTTSGVRPGIASPQIKVPGKTAETTVRPAELELFEQSVALFTQGKFYEALAGFDSFLKLYPHSPLVPNASLYRGDCFLRLSEL